MSITTALIGKLGGADVEKIDVSMSGNGSGTEHVLHEVVVPAGEKLLVALEGTFTRFPTGFYTPAMRFGPYVSEIPRDAPSDYAGGGVLSETGNVSVITQGSPSSARADFSGTLYIVPL